jgi:DNA-binding transcriptional ArsR family regulator
MRKENLIGNKFNPIGTLPDGNSRTECQVVTDGGRSVDPTKLGYRTLAVLASEARLTAAVVSELRSHPAVDVSEQAVRRTLRALQQTGLVTRDDNRRWVITDDGRAVERAERRWRTDHAATRTETAPRRTALRGDGEGDPRTDGGREAAPPSHDTPLTYQMRCGSCAKLIGMSARYCSRCGTKVDHADANEDDATRKLFTGGDR